MRVIAVDCCGNCPLQSEGCFCHYPEAEPNTNDGVVMHLEPDEGLPSWCPLIGAPLTIWPLSTKGAA